MPVEPQVNVKMSSELEHQLRRAAADLRISRSELVRLAIESFLSQENMVKGTADAIKLVESKHGINS